MLGGGRTRYANVTARHMAELRTAGVDPRVLREDSTSNPPVLTGGIRSGTCARQPCRQEDPSSSGCRPWRPGRRWNADWRMMLTVPSSCRRCRAPPGSVCGRSHPDRSRANGSRPNRSAPRRTATRHEQLQLIGDARLSRSAARPWRCRPQLIRLTPRPPACARSARGLRNCSCCAGVQKPSRSTPARCTRR